jgi:hypothetical protein
VQAIDQIGFFEQKQVYLSDAILGATLGFCVGFMLGLADGILSRSLLRGLRSGFLTGMLGLLAGAIALPLGELVFLQIGGEIAGRAVGWGIFGSLLGFADSVSSRTQAWKGALGGLIGGALGGVLLETVLGQFSDLLIGKVIGLILLGASIGILTALITVALSRAWLEVKTGKLTGAEFILDKFMGEKSPSAIIGSNVLKSDIALPDPDIAPQHASLKGAGTHFMLQDMSVNSGTFVNNRRVELHRLGDRQSIRMGSTELVYHERR